MKNCEIPKIAAEMTPAQWLAAEAWLVRGQPPQPPSVLRGVLVYRGEARALFRHAHEVADRLQTIQRRALKGAPYARRPRMPAGLGSWGGYANAYFQPSAWGHIVARALRDDLPIKRRDPQVLDA